MLGTNEVLLIICLQLLPAYSIFSLTKDHVKSNLSEAQRMLISQIIIKSK